MASLEELAVATVALHTPVPELLTSIERLPTCIRHELFQQLSKFRLREMEVAWEAAAKVDGPKEARDGFDPRAGDSFLFDRETQREWKTRLEQCDVNWSMVSTSWNMEGCTRNYRHVFWELEFLSMLKRQEQQDLMEIQKRFGDVVRVLELPGQLICKANAEIFLALRYLQSLKVFGVDQQPFCWATMRRLMKENRALTELKIVYGSLSDSGVAHLYATLAKPSLAVEKRMDTGRITTLEFVAVNFQPEGYRRLVALVSDMAQLVQLRVENCMKQFDKKLLVRAALCLPALERLFVERNKLQDDAFGELLVDIRKPLALRQLHLDHNKVSLKTIEAMCQASRKGVLTLERLGLSYNSKITDPAIHALTPLLASRGAGSATVLTHLDLSSCSFGLEGVTSLLVALSHNQTLTHLNVAWNGFGIGFGDVLAEFLLTNPSVTHIEAGYVHLELADVSARLLTAFESNRNLTFLSLKENCLRSAGATLILGALGIRAQVKPFTLVDLSDNSH